MAPVFILSNQRTGGTRLADYLSVHFDGALHEPFNKGRCWFHLYDNHQKIGFFSKEIKQEVLNSNAIVKHCVEVQNHDFNRDLTRFIWGSGAKVIVLRRVIERHRIRSLEEHSPQGRWFPDIHSQGWKNPSSIEELENKSLATIRTNKQVDELLATHEPSLTIKYERLYSKKQSLAVLQEIYSHLEISVIPDEKITTEFLGSGKMPSPSSI